jgi:thiamine-phosphate pyrophosphorylase
LYLILDTQVNSYERLMRIAAAAVFQGIDIVQLRDKSGLAKDMIDFSRQLMKILSNRVPLIINDRVDVALAAGASGVHLGQDDLPLRWARKMMGKKAIIGSSCQNLDQVKEAQRQRADYIGFGSVFKTLTKPARRPMDLNLIKNIFLKTKVPVFAIGGINQKNVGRLSQQGINRIAVCREICLARDAGAAARLLRKEMLP